MLCLVVLDRAYYVAIRILINLRLLLLQTKQDILWEFFFCSNVMFNYLLIYKYLPTIQSEENEHAVWYDLRMVLIYYYITIVGNIREVQLGRKTLETEMIVQ